MEKIVIDLDGGLTRLSDEAIELYAQLKSKRLCLLT